MRDSRGAQEFRLEGPPAAVTQLSQGTNRGQAAIRACRIYGQIGGASGEEKFSETMELLLEPSHRFFTRTQATRPAIRSTGGDSANPTRIVGVFGNQFRVLPETRIECHHVCGDPARHLCLGQKELADHRFPTFFGHHAQEVRNSMAAVLQMNSARRADVSLERRDGFFHPSLG